MSRIDSLFYLSFKHFLFLLWAVEYVSDPPLFYWTKLSQFTRGSWTHRSRGGLWKVFGKLFDKPKLSRDLSESFEAVRQASLSAKNAEQCLRGLVGRWYFWFRELSQAASDHFTRPELGEWLHAKFLLAPKLASCHIADFMVTDVRCQGRHKSVSDQDC